MLDRPLELVKERMWIMDQTFEQVINRILDLAIDWIWTSSLLMLGSGMLRILVI